MPLDPEGLLYVAEFVSAGEERVLLEHVSAAPFREIRMRGQVALRRTAHYGWDYGYESWKITPTTPVPEWLHPLRGRAAALIGIDPQAFEEVLLTEYPRGSGIGWHRDALGLRAVRPRADKVAAFHSAQRGASLLDHVPDNPGTRLTVRAQMRIPTPCRFWRQKARTRPQGCCFWPSPRWSEAFSPPSPSSSAPRRP